MGLRDLLCIPKWHHRSRSKARSEVIEDPSGADLTVPLPRRTQSTPDLRIDDSTSPVSGPSTSGDQGRDGHPANAGLFRSVLKQGESAGPGSSDPVVKAGATDEKKSHLKSLASSGAKFILRGVNESADAFGPLKSVAGGLCYFLDNYERTEANEQSMESLARRVGALADSLCASDHQDDIKEKSRRKFLEEKLNNVARELDSLTKQGNVEGFIKNVKNADRLAGLVEDIRDAIMEYQTSLQQDIYKKNSMLIERSDLALLDRMYHITNAGYLCGDRQGCMKGTRRDTLNHLENWLNGQEDKHVFWLNGLAGTGKSTIAQTFAETSFADGKLGASFFCSRNFEDRSNLRSIFPTLAFQLAYQYPLFCKALLPVLTTSHDVGRESLCSQMEKLIVEPFQATQIPTLIIIDALDECQDNEPASAILSVLSRYVDKIPSVKFLITGRPEPRISEGFHLESLEPTTEVFKLHDVEPSSVESDIRLFFRTRLAEITKARNNCTFPQDWPKSSDIDILCKKAAGFFIYASVVVKFVASPSRIPTEQLDQVVLLPQRIANEGKGIDSLYTQVLEQAVGDVEADDDDKEEIYSCFKTVVGAVLLVFNSLPIGALSELLRVSNNKVSTTLSSLNSLLLIPGAERIGEPIRVFHKSFPDFLMDSKRCSKKWFFVDKNIYHAKISLLCLGLMKERLRRNICNLDDYVLLSEVEELSGQRKNYTGDALEYACQFWTKHLLETPKDSPAIGELEKEIKEFFTKRLLYWIEVLILTGNLDAGVYAMNDVEQWCASVGIPCTWTNDTQRFLLEHFDTIKDFPSHIYHSALPFCPSSSWLQKEYSTEILDKVKVANGLPAEWGSCYRAVDFAGPSFALSSWKNSIAVGMWSGIILILDAITGSQTAVISLHEGGVNSVTFSLDGALLVSGSLDGTIKLWDVQTGGAIKTFIGHTGRMLSVSISADSAMIASGSDQAIQLWSIQTGECCHQISKQEPVDQVIFHPLDPQYFMSVSDEKVQHWDINGHQIGEESRSTCVAFSLDGTKLALCYDGVVTVKDFRSGAIVAEFHPDEREFGACCFSPDSKLIAAAVGHIIYVWEIKISASHPIETFLCDTVLALEFTSPSTLVSNSFKFKFWQIGASSTKPVSSDPKSGSSSPAQTISVNIQVNNDTVITSDINGVVEIWDILTGHCKGSFQTEARGRNHKAQLAGDKLIIVQWQDKDVTVSDVETQELLWHKHFGNISQGIEAGISEDGSKIFFKEESGPILVLSLWTGEVEDMISSSEQFGALHLDGSRVWTDYGEHSEGWEFGIPGSSPVQLSNIPPNKLHPSGTIMWNIFQHRVQDVDTGEVLFQLAKGYGFPADVKWKNQYLYMCFFPRKVFILDFSHLLPQ